MRGISIATVLLAACVAYVTYLRPTEPQLAFVRTRLSVAQGELATLLGRTVIEPRLRREHVQIAKRLGPIAADSPSEAETAFLSDATRLAKRTGTHITQIVGKGAPLPLAQATGGPVPVPAASASPSGFGPRPIASGPLPIAANDVRGVRLPRTVTVVGSLGGLLRFVDGMGALRPLVRVNRAGLAQTDLLRATIDVDLVVLDAMQVREALL